MRNKIIDQQLCKDKVQEYKNDIDYKHILGEVILNNAV